MPPPALHAGVSIRFHKTGMRAKERAASTPSKPNTSAYNDKGDDRDAATKVTTETRRQRRKVTGGRCTGDNLDDVTPRRGGQT